MGDSVLNFLSRSTFFKSDLFKQCECDGQTKIFLEPISWMPMYRTVVVTKAASIVFVSTFNLGFCVEVTISESFMVTKGKIVASIFEIGFDAKMWCVCEYG